MCSDKFHGVTDGCEIVRAAEALLVKRGLLNPMTGGKLAFLVDGENTLLYRWRLALAGFIRKGWKVEVGMRVERLTYGESRCYPLIDVV